MVRRVGIALALVFVLGVLGVPTAQAKGPTKAVLTGPSLERQAIWPSWRPKSGEVDLDELMQVTRFWERWANQRDGDPEPPAGKLGPRFDVTYHFGIGAAARQELYPLAAGGPVVYTPDSVIWSSNVGGGWSRTSLSLPRILTDLGADLPRVQAEWQQRADAADPAPGSVSSSSAPAGVGGWIAGGLVLIGVAAALIGFRRYRLRMS